MSDNSVDQWIRRETPKHAELLSKMRAKLEASLEERVDEHGFTVLPDLTPAGTPNRDWCRAFARYATGFANVLGQQLEREKMRLLAKRAGMATLTDDEYEREMIELGREAVKELPTADLAEELMRRGLTLPSADNLTES